MKFRNPQNGHVEEIDSPGLWTFLLGPFYLAYKGVWTWAVLGFVTALFTGGLFWLVLPFFAAEAIRKSFLQRGWTEEGEAIEAPAKPKRSPKQEAEHQRKLAEAAKKMGW